ncbi:sigma-E factor regulatory protein RseC [Vibrio zhanjiangensis]|uniref:Sigma-E factor regulatory protein RseC n=1 Tax=Vibrio zhanjiangensis TaxID=1046128 RepID=A0ABQ6EZF8_9VIBR|nr:SoxR reducing system RseC family protein [Vibrio zhanjiangensis]GLT18184.1 sigma-E factor regulatory protein RseC [Vibrio zhanjiangensis]
MMTALATVSSVTPTNGGYALELSCDQQTSCSSCSSQKSCGTGMISKALGSKSLHWYLYTNLPVKQGQLVEIGLAERDILQSAVVVYLVPLLSMIFGAIAGEWLLSPLLNLGEGLTILSSALATLGGIYCAKRLVAKLERRSLRDVKLLRVLGEPIS